MQDASEKPIGGESRQVFRDRIEKAFEQTLNFDSPVRIVSHGAVWLTLQDIVKIAPVKVENGVPFRIFCDENKNWKANKL